MNFNDNWLMILNKNETAAVTFIIFVEHKGKKLNKHFEGWREKFNEILGFLCLCRFHSIYATSKREGARWGRIDIALAPAKHTTRRCTIRDYTYFLPWERRLHVLVDVAPFLLDSFKRLPFDSSFFVLFPRSATTSGLLFIFPYRFASAPIPFNILDKMVDSGLIHEAGKQLLLRTTI